VGVSVSHGVQQDATLPTAAAATAAQQRRARQAAALHCIVHTASASHPPWLACSRIASSSTAR
jgi:hypothetical protein